MFSLSSSSVLFSFLLPLFLLTQLLPYISSYCSSSALVLFFVSYFLFHLFFVLSLYFPLFVFISIYLLMLSLGLRHLFFLFSCSSFSLNPFLFLCHFFFYFSSSGTLSLPFSSTSPFSSFNSSYSLWHTSCRTSSPSLFLFLIWTLSSLLFLLSFLFLSTFLPLFLQWQSFVVVRLFGHLSLLLYLFLLSYFSCSSLN